MQIVLFILAGIAAWAAHAGVFYQTGPEWFEACWAKQRTSSEVSRPAASDPEQAVAWAQCEPMARSATYAVGIDFLHKHETVISNSDANNLEQHCPSIWDIPGAGWYARIVSLIEERGGISFVESFMPSNYLLEEVISEAWPRCKIARENLGYRVTSGGITWRIADDNRGENKNEDEIQHPPDIQELLDKYAPI